MAGCSEGGDGDGDAGGDAGDPAAADTGRDAGDDARADVQMSGDAGGGGDGGTDASGTADAGDTSMMSDTRWPDVDDEMCGRYAADGPHPVGVTRIDVDGTAVEVWYPAADGAGEGRETARYDMREWLPEDERDEIPDDKAPFFEMDAYRDVAASAEGPFPVVLFSHGFAGYRMQSTFLTVHLASWGYVVASADHPGRGLAAVLEGNLSREDDAPATMEAVRDELRSRAMADSGRFSGLIDDNKLAVTGHSAGAGSAVSFAVDNPADAVVGYAGGPMDTSSPIDINGEVFLMAGTRDGIVPASRVRSAWEALNAPGTRRYLSLKDAGHLAFSDICLIGRDRGGLLEIASRNGVNVPNFIKTLASDGCRDDDIPPELIWPMLNHYTVAQLRASLGQDASPTGLDEQTASCFGGLVDEFVVE